MVAGSPGPPWAANGLAPPRCRRRAPPLTRQQRVWITVLAAAAGLLFAWVVQRGGGGGGSGGGTQRATSGLLEERLPTEAEREAARQKVKAALQKLSALQHAKAGGGETGGGGVRAAAAAQQQQQPAAQAQPKGEQQAALAAQQQQPAAGAGAQQQAATAEGGAQQQPAQGGASRLPGMEDESEWFRRLSSEACAHAEQLRVCSHRGRVAAEGPAPGSLSAYAALHKGGVSCFDVDFVATGDGQLLASHPDDLATALPPGTRLDASLAELRAAGADEERFPTADALIKVFAALLEQSGLLWRAGQGRDPPDYEQLPVLLMDLKGAAFSPAGISSAAAAAAAVGAEAHVALFASTDGQLLLARNGSWAGPLIRGYMDTADPNPTVTPESVEPFALLGPSIRMADAFFASAARLGKPALAWTVDTPAQLHRALEANLNAVISNAPLALRGVLLDWRDRCSERTGRLKHAAARRRARRRRGGAR